MAVAVKNPPSVSSSSPFDRPWVVSLLGVAYVLASFAIVFKLIPNLWWRAWDGMGLDRFPFVGGALMGIVMIAAGIALLVVGGWLLGPKPPLGVRAGIFVGFVGLVFVLLLARWMSVWVEHWVYDTKYFTPRTGVIIVAVGAVLLLALGLYLYTLGRTQRFIVWVEEGGWFSAKPYKPSQGLKVRRGTIFGCLMLIGAGIYTLISHGSLKRGPSDWHIDLPFTARTAIQSIGDTQRWLISDVPPEAKNTVQVRRPGATDLPARQNTSAARFQEKLQGVLAAEKYTARTRTALETAAAKDITELLIQINHEIYRAIVVGLGRVEVKTVGSTELTQGETATQKRFRDEVRGRLAALQDRFLLKQREALNKANQEDDLVSLLKEIDIVMAGEVPRVLGRVKVRTAGATGLKEKETVGPQELRAKIKSILEAKERKRPFAPKTHKALIKANESGKLDDLVKEINARLRRGMEIVLTPLTGEKTTTFFDEKTHKALTKKFEKIKANKDADIAPVVAAFLAAAEKAKKRANLPAVFDLPVVTVVDEPLLPLAESNRLRALEKKSGIEAVVAELSRMAPNNARIPAVFHLPTAVVKDVPFFRSQRDIKALWEIEPSTTWMDLTPLIDEYVRLAEAASRTGAMGEGVVKVGVPGDSKFSYHEIVEREKFEKEVQRCKKAGLAPPQKMSIGLPTVFDLPTGLLVLDRYTLRDVNEKAEGYVKVGLPGGSDLKYHAIVSPTEFDAEVQRCKDEGLTPPERLSVALAGGPTSFESLTLLPAAQFTVPLILLAVSLWVAWRIVNIPAFADFLIATEAELNKVSWTTQRRLVQDTIVVLATVFLMAVYLFAMDQGWRVLLSWKPVGVLYIPPDEEKTNKELEQKSW